jgi:hypothetical protein
MGQLARNISAKKQAISFILVLPVLFVLLYFSLLKLNTSNNMLKESFWAHKVTADSVYDLVAVGDSRVYRGIDPEEIEAQYFKLNGSKIQALNFGFSSAGLEPYILEKAKALLKHDGKRMLLIGISPNSFIESSQENGHLKKIESQDAKDLWIKKNIYPELYVFRRYAISDFVKYKHKEFYLEKFNLNSGFVGSSKLPYDSTAAINQYSRQLKANKIDTFAVRMFLETLQKLKEEGIKIVAIRIPTTERMRILEDKLTSNFCQDLFSKIEEEGIECIRVQDSRIHSYDASHLDEKSAKLLSVKVANLIFSK